MYNFDYMNRALTHTHIYTYIYTYIHTYIHTYDLIFLIRILYQMSHLSKILRLMQFCFSLLAIFF